MAKIYVLCSVRGVTDEYRNKLEKYVSELESNGHIVHLPHRDTKQNDTGINICTQNCNAIKNSDEIHVFYSSKSTGTHFDMGAAFVLDKPIKIIENEPYDEGKSFPRMLAEWENRTK